jgi:hypothetical protein
MYMIVTGSIFRGSLSGTFLGGCPNEWNAPEEAGGSHRPAHPTQTAETSRRFSRLSSRSLNKLPGPQRRGVPEVHEVENRGEPRKQRLSQIPNPWASITLLPLSPDVRTRKVQPSSKPSSHSAGLRFASDLAAAPDLKPQVRRTSKNGQVGWPRR